MLSAPLDRAAIAALIPHQGAMCLLDSVRSWDAETIRCTASSHRDPGNPLASRGALDVLCGIEYAAQAMAVHGSLAAAGKRSSAGYLASVREVICHVSRLDAMADDLEIAATRLAGNQSTASYSFTLGCGGATLLQGRAVVVLEG